MSMEEWECEPRDTCALYGTYTTPSSVARRSQRANRLLEIEPSFHFRSIKRSLNITIPLMKVDKRSSAVKMRKINLLWQKILPILTIWTQSKCCGGISAV